MSELMSEIAKVPATLFSPAKMVYIAYVILLAWKTQTPSHCEFFVVSVFFLFIEIAHNDWGRIRLNNSGKRNTPEWEKKQPANP
jgi:hypothetical protein